MGRWTDTERDRLARRLHRCPDGYEGPCWGPTAADYADADAVIAARAARTAESETPAPGV